MHTTKEIINEIWKDIVSYEGLYRVSNLGNIQRTNGNSAKSRKNLTTTNGYLRLPLSMSGVSKRFMVHRLVATAFIPNPQKKSQVNHINGIKTDNRIENLQWSTAKENIRHSVDILKSKLGMRMPVMQISFEGFVLNEFESVRQASIVTKTYSGSITNCLNGKQKQAGGFLWV